MEKFYIQMGKTMARNEQAIRALAKASASNSKSIFLFGICLVGLCIVNVSQDKQIAKLNKRVADLEIVAKKKEIDELDFLK